MTANEDQFRADLRTWTPGTHAENLPEWTVNTDGSITIRLDPVLAVVLADEMVRWKRLSEIRLNCENWKRSAIARENRRESIVYGNALSTVQTLLGRRQLLALMEWVSEIDKEEENAHT